MTAHVHADLMALYAQDAKETDKPWERWQFQDGLNDWTTCTTHPAWISGHLYRRKTSNGEKLYRAFYPEIDNDYQEASSPTKAMYERAAERFLNSIKEQ